MKEVSESLFKLTQSIVRLAISMTSVGIVCIVLSMVAGVFAGVCSAAFDLTFHIFGG